MFVETLHLQFPFTFGDECFGTNDKDGLDFVAGLQFLQNKPGFNGLANPDFIGHQKSGAVCAYEFEYGSVLVRYKSHAS